MPQMLTAVPQTYQSKIPLRNGGNESHLLMALLSSQKDSEMRCFMMCGSEDRIQLALWKSYPLIKKKQPKNVVVLHHVSFH